MDPIHIIIDKTAETAQSFDYLGFIINCVGLVSTLIGIWVMITGIRAINRIKQKSEDATFGFYARFLVYLNLLADSFGTKNCSVLFFLFTDDIRVSTYSDKTPPLEYAEKFRDLSIEVLGYLKEADGQIAFSKSFYENRKKLIHFLISTGKTLGEFHPYSSETDLTSLENQIDEFSTVLNKMITEIECQQDTILKPLWKQTGKQIEKANKGKRSLPFKKRK